MALKILKIFRYILTVAFLSVVLWGVCMLFRVFVFDTFIVRGTSMEPTLHDGERVCVNKLKLGARIYKEFDFASPYLECFRMPGFRKVQVGDVVVINDPYSRCNDSITFTINQVYIKRCYGCPGDTLRIKNGRFIHPDTKGPIGPACYQDELSKLGDSLSRSLGIYVDAWNINRREKWTILDLGPICVPRKGGVVSLTPENYRSYRKQIHYETGKWLKIRAGNVFLGENIITEYKFLTDWYFLCGDNVLNSRDSRYVGFMPESFIVGIVNP